MSLFTAMPTVTAEESAGGDYYTVLNTCDSKDGISANPSLSVGDYSPDGSAAVIKSIKGSSGAYVDQTEYTASRRVRAL